MSQNQVDILLGGAAGINVNLTDGRTITLTRRELTDPEAFRQVWIEAGAAPPEYTPEEVDDLIGVLFRLAGKTTVGVVLTSAVI
jgi:hypothetical protein